MRPNINSSQSGQAKAEYALLIALLGLVVIAVLILLGPRISNLLNFASNSISGQTASAEKSIQDILSDFQARIQAFFDAHGYWPRSWGDYRFTDLGLNPADWIGPVNGIYWSPNGEKVGLSNKAGDNIQLYVKDLQGNELHLYDGWNIWCVVGGACYYHTVAPGNEVDISTLRAVIN